MAHRAVDAAVAPCKGPADFVEPWDKWHAGVVNWLEEIEIAARCEIAAPEVVEAKPVVSARRFDIFNRVAACGIPADTDP